MKKLNAILLLLLVVFSCQEVENEPDFISEYAYPEMDLAVAEPIAQQVQFTPQGVSRKQLNDLYYQRYEIDFATEYSRLLADPALSDVFSEGTDLIGEANQKVTSSGNYRPVVYSFNIEDNAALASLSQGAIIHFKRLYDIIDPDNIDASSKTDFIKRVKNRIGALRSNVRNNCCMSANEKNILYAALDAYRDNIEEVYDIVDRSFDDENGRHVQTNINARFRLKRFFRRVRSVVVSVAVAAGAGFATAGPVGALIGAGAGLVGSVLDLVFNDRCHYALQCDGGWEQDCKTGQCIKDPDWPRSGDDGSDGIYLGETDYSNIKGPNTTYKYGEAPANNCRGCEGEGNIAVESIDVYPFTQDFSGEFPFSLEGAVDMAEAPAGGSKSKLGFPRNNKYFWATYTDPHQALSAKNKQLISEGLSPKVDELWQRQMPGQSAAKIGEVIEHHHLLHGRWAIPIARSLHRGKVWYSKLHPKYTSSAAFLKTKNALKRASKTIIGRLSLFADIYDLLINSFSEDPHALINTISKYEDGGPLYPPFGGSMEADRIYYIQEIDAYFKPDIIFRSSTTSGGGLIQKGTPLRIIWKIYENYGYNSYTKKYFGIGVIKTGYSDRSGWEHGDGSRTYITKDKNGMLP